MEIQLEKLYDSFKIFMSSLNIFNNIDEILNDTHKKNAITSMLINIKKRNNFESIPKTLFSGNPQFNNIAGFEAIYNKAGQIHSPFIPPSKPNIFKTLYDKLGNNTNETRTNWHYDMLYVIYNVFHNKKVDSIITSMNEEWHNFKVNGPNDEFVTLNQTNTIKKGYKIKYPIDYLGKIVKPITHVGNKCDPKGMEHIIKHRIFYIGDNVILVNIHSASNMGGNQISHEIIKLLKSIIKTYNKFKIILGGDSNVYYGNVDSKNDGVSDINYLAGLLNKMKYNLLISRHIVAKYRPYNYFQNAQSATKGGDWTNAETMIVVYPNDLDISYDKKHYLELSGNQIKVTEFHNKYCYGFLGTRYKNMDRKSHVNSINSKNWHNNLYSDHVPIYCDLNINSKTVRIIFTNNLSINSDRGINNNSSKFKIKNVKKLESLSKKEIVNFFIKEIEALLGNNNVEKHSDNLIYLKRLLKETVKHDITNIKKTKKTKKSKKPKSNFKKLWKTIDNCINFNLIKL